jgi:hypothetical protein
MVANAALFVALAGVWRLASDYGSRRVAVIAVWTAAVAVRGGLLEGVSVFAVARGVDVGVRVPPRSALSRRLAGAVATLARPNGIAVVVALAVAVWSDARASRLTGTRRPTARRLVTVCGPGMAALTLWCVELARRTGNPLVFWTAKRA